MTEQEKAEILDELEKRMEAKYKGCLTKDNVGSVLKVAREKWFNNDHRYNNESLMSNAFGSSIIAWQVWEVIRKLTCVVFGKQYVRHLANEPYAEEVAEKICQFIYDLRMECKEEAKRCINSEERVRENGDQENC